MLLTPNISEHKSIHFKVYMYPLVLNKYKGVPLEKVCPSDSFCFIMYNICVMYMILIALG